MPELHPLSFPLDGIEEYAYTSEHGRRRIVRRVAIAPPVVWRQATGQTGFVGITVTLVNSTDRDAAHYERLRAGLAL